MNEINANTKCGYRACVYRMEVDCRQIQKYTGTIPASIGTTPHALRLLSGLLGPFVSTIDRPPGPDQPMK